MNKILINGEQADLYEDTEFESSFQVCDISSLTSSKSDSTSTINFPPTAKNRRLLGVSGGSNNRNRTRYSKIRADIINDGVAVMGNATCVVHEIAENIRTNIFKGAIDLFALIGEDLLSDLDLSDLNHRRNRTVIVTNRNTTSGFIYPVVNYGKLNIDNTTFLTAYQLPSVFAHTLVERIIERAGFSVSGRITQDDNYKNFVVILSTVLPGVDSESELQVARSQVSASATYTGTSLRTYILADLQLDFAGNDIVPCFSINTMSGAGLPAGAIANPTVTTYEVQMDGTYRFEASVTVQANNVSSLNPCKLYLFSEPQGSVGSDARVFTSKINVFSGVATYNVSSDWVRLERGDRIFVIVEIPNSSNTPQETVSILLANLSCMGARDTKEHVYNTTYDLARNMPEITQKEFLKGVFAAFQIIPIVNTDTGTVKLWSYRDGYLDTGQAVDYSGKIDMSQPITRTSKIPGFAKSNLFKYSNASETGEYYGSGKLLVDDNSIAEESKTLVTLPFSASQHMFRVLNGEIPVTILLQVYDITTGYYDEDVDGVRVGYLKRFPSTGTIQFQDDSGNTTVSTNMCTVYFHYNETGYPSLGFEDSENSEGLLNYYSGIASLLDTSEMVSASIKLSASDIANLDFTKPVYIKELRANYIINKIDNYKSGSTANIQLIRM